MLEKRMIVTDKTTGEYTERKSIIADIFTGDGYLFMTHHGFVKSFRGIRLSDVIGTGDDFRKIHLLAEQLSPHTNVVMDESGNAPRPMTDMGMSDLFGCSLETIQKFISRMMKKEVLAQVTTKVGDASTLSYVINPLYFLAGKRLDYTLYYAFRDSIDPYLTAWARAGLMERAAANKEIETAPEPDSPTPPAA